MRRASAPERGRILLRHNQLDKNEAKGKAKPSIDLAILASLLALLASPVAGAADAPFIPYFWNPQSRAEKPDAAGVRAIRFVTDDEYPPFGFVGADGGLTGFNVDLARAVCEELKVACTVQARRWDTILDSVEAGQADAAIASIAINPQTRRRVEFTAPYYRTPARFVSRVQTNPERVDARALAGKTVGVQQKSAHEAYLREFFGQADIRIYDNQTALRSALKRGEVDLVFGDGVSLSVWLNSIDAEGCCAFQGGPYTESRYFGEGVGVAVKKDNAPLRRLIDYALARIAERGVYAELYLKYFPIGFY